MSRANPTRQEYEADICARRADAVTVPFVEISHGDWAPAVGKCHGNVDRWIADHPEYEAVRGWILYQAFGPAGVALTAHSVVRNPDGSLVDITPVERGALRGGAFVEHRGDDALFCDMKREQHEIRCPSLDPEADAAELQALVARYGGLTPPDNSEESI